MTAALEDAELSPTDVGYVNAHGTSTPINDRVETIALRKIFSDDGPPVSSCKGAVGHTLGAAGAIEALACVEALRRGALPPTLGLEDIDPECGRRPHRRRAARGARPEGRAEQLVRLPAGRTRPSSCRRLGGSGMSGRLRRSA